MKKIRSVLSFMLILSTLFSVSTYAYYEPKIRYSTPLPAGTDYPYPIASRTRTFDLDKSTGIIAYEASVKGTGNVTKSEVSAVIQRHDGGNWVDVPGTSVTATSNSYFASFAKEYCVNKGYMYRMEVTYAVYVGSTKYVEVFETNSISYY